MSQAEMGADMSVFGRAQCLPSWVGMCPSTNESPSKRKSGPVRKGIACVRAGHASFHKEKSRPAPEARPRNLHHLIKTACFLIKIRTLISKTPSFCTQTLHLNEFISLTLGSVVSLATLHSDFDPWIALFLIVLFWMGLAGQIPDEGVCP
jgi:hypothetical protein